MLATFLIYFIILILGVGIFRKNNYILTISSTKIGRIEIVYIIIYTLIIGLRYDVGVDYIHYLGTYQKYIDAFPNTPVLRRSQAVEFAYDLLYKLLAALNGHYSIFFIINAYLNIYFIYYFARQYPKQEPYILFFYIASMTFFDTFNLIRQMTAFFMFICTFKYISERKFLKYLLCIVLISLFHRSIWMMLPFYFFIDKKIFNNRFLCIGILLICFLFSDRIADFIWTKIFDTLAGALTGVKDASYLVRTQDLLIESNSGSLGLMRFLMLFFDILIVWNYHKLEKFYKGTDLQIIYNLFFIGACMYFISVGSIALIRMNLYFYNCLFIMLAFLTYFLLHPSRRLTEFKKILSLVTAVVIVSASLALYTNAILKGTKNAPYLFINEAPK